MIKRIIFCIFLIVTTTSVFSQVNKITGTWKSVDDKTGDVRSEVRIYKATNGKYYGKIEKLYTHTDSKCIKCKGADKDKPVLGLIIMKDLIEDDGELVGKVLDPESGDIYYATVSYEKDKNRLKLRGSIDKLGLIGCSQYWLPVKK